MDVGLRQARGGGCRCLLVVDDQELVRAGFEMILERGGLEVVGEAADGIEAVRQLIASRPEIRIVVLTTFNLDEYVYEAVRAGASGFLLKDISPTDLVHAVDLIARGDALLAPAPTRRLLDRYAFQPFPATKRDQLAAVTDRETDVLRLVGQGRSNAEIATELFLSEATIKTYVSRRLTKLDRRDRVQLAVLPYECGVVVPGEGIVGDA